MIKKIITIGLVLLIISLIGCAKKAPPVEEVPTTEEKVEEVSSDIADVGALDEDLDISDLESIDKEIEEINW